LAEVVDLVEEENAMSVTNFDTSLVTKMMEEALEFCADKAGLGGKEQAMKALRSGDCCACEYMRYAMAQRLAAYLGSVDDTIKTVYTYEPEYATTVDGAIPGRPNLTPGFNLVVKVSRKSAALSSLVSSVNSALSDACRSLGCPAANALCYEFDVGVADEEDVQKRVGYAALIDSLYVRPIEVWSR
jgi:hypothetical protein